MSFVHLYSHRTLPRSVSKPPLQYTFTTICRVPMVLEVIAHRPYFEICSTSRHIFQLSLHEKYFLQGRTVARKICKNYHLKQHKDGKQTVVIYGLVLLSEIIHDPSDILIFVHCNCRNCSHSEAISQISQPQKCTRIVMSPSAQS